MKYYLFAPDGLHISCLQEEAINKFIDGEETKELVEGCIEVKNPSHDLLENFIYYKLVEGELVKMSDEEFKELYPNYGVVVPTDIEVLQHENHLLKAQVKALTEQGEFQDDLIAEIATVVYA